MRARISYLHTTKSFLSRTFREKAAVGLWNRYVVRTIGAESRIRAEGPIGTLFEVHKMRQVESRKTPGTFKQGSRLKPGRSPAIDYERAMTLDIVRFVVHPSSKNETEMAIHVFSNVDYEQDRREKIQGKPDDLWT